MLELKAVADDVKMQVGLCQLAASRQSFGQVLFAFHTFFALTHHSLVALFGCLSLRSVFSAFRRICAQSAYGVVRRMTLLLLNSRGEAQWAMYGERMERHQKCTIDQTVMAGGSSYLLKASGYIGLSGAVALYLI